MATRSNGGKKSTARKIGKVSPANLLLINKVFSDARKSFDAWVEAEGNVHAAARRFATHVYELIFRAKELEKANVNAFREFLATNYGGQKPRTPVGWIKGVTSDDYNKNHRPARTKLSYAIQAGEKLNATPEDFEEALAEFGIDGLATAFQNSRPKKKRDLSAARKNAGEKIKDWLENRNPILKVGPKPKPIPLDPDIAKGLGSSPTWVLALSMADKKGLHPDSVHLVNDDPLIVRDVVDRYSVEPGKKATERNQSAANRTPSGRTIAQLTAWMREHRAEA